MDNPMFPTLRADQIEVKVKQVAKSGAILLLYKTARTDYDVLDAAVGPGRWQASYAEVKGNLYCTISIWDDALGQWISKSNCGTESREDGEGNEKKGEASDAMKRAGFTWGIGRELYTSPFIFANVPVEQNGQKYVLVNRFEQFDVRDISCDDQRRISRLVISNSKGDPVFSFGANSPAGRAKESSKPDTSAHTGTPSRGTVNSPTDDVPPPPTPPPESPDATPPWETPQDACNTPPAMASDYQLKRIRELATPEQLALLQKTYGQNLERLTKLRAVEAIDRIYKDKRR